MKHITSFLAIILLSVGVIQAQETFIGKQMSKRLTDHAYFLAADSLEGRCVGSLGGDKAAHYIAEQFKAIGLQPYNGKSWFHGFSKDFKGANFNTIAKINGKNVIGIIEGTDNILKNFYIVIGAHYDHLGIGTKSEKHPDAIYNGADDNASGVSALIELARSIKESGTRPGYTLVFVAFDGEEQGLWGSTAFVQDQVFPVANIHAMFSLDMLGYYQANHRLNYYGTSTFKDFNQYILSSPLNVNYHKRECNIVTATDTRPFAEKGIPTLHITTGTRNSPYHKVHDEAGKLDYIGLENIVNQLQKTTMAMATSQGIKSNAKEHSPQHHIFHTPYTYGLVFGFGASSLSYSNAKLRSFGRGSGFIGAKIRLQHKEWLEYGPDAILERTSYYYHMNYIDENKTKLNIYSLKIPFNVTFQTPATTDIGIRAFITLSPFYRHTIKGHYRHPQFMTSNHTTIRYKDQFYKNEGGLELTLGIKTSRWSWGLNFSDSFTPMNKKAPNHNDSFNHACWLRVEYNL